jgi:glutamyl-tRNA synthetase
LSLNQDFIVWTRQGTPSYQLAVVVDDHRQGVTDVIRGNDLLKSAAWQELIYEAMDWEKPNWHHLPLVLGSDGKRLAKRHGDTRLTTFRKQGVTPERIIALIANWCNIRDDRSDMNATTFSQLLNPADIPKDDIVFTEMDEAWLLE